MNINRLLLVLFTLFPLFLFAQSEQMLFGDTSRLDVAFSKDPHVIYFQGRYLMYYSIPPFKGETLGWNIGIAESYDLVNWTRVGEISSDPEAVYEKNGLCAPGALVKDGKVHLFYQTYGNGAKDAICHAISDDGLVFRRDLTNPIFRPSGDWNCGRAIDAEVVEYNGQYFLYFATRDPQYKQQIMGVAIAPHDTDFGRDDWTLAVDSAILRPELKWEGDCVEGASVIERNGLLYMFYAGSYNNSPQQIGVAESKDGLVWKRIFNTPFIPNGGVDEWNHCESGHPHIFLDKGGKTFLFYQGNNDYGKTWYITNEEIVWKNGKPKRMRE